NGCQNTTLYDNIQVMSTQPNFKINTSSGCSPLTVNFTNLSSNSTKWFWNFGDGSTSSSFNPTHVFAQDGHYDITLATQNSFGCVDTITYATMINVFNAELNVGTGDTSNGCMPLQVDFSNNTVGKNKWFWDFGDGTTSTSSSPTHIYTTPGTHTVSLATETAFGCYVNIDNYATYIVEDAQPNFGVAQYDCQDFVIQFYDSTSNAGTWFWDFGDGTYSNQQNPLHLFPGASVFDVQLTIHSANGCTESMLYLDYIDFVNCKNSGSDGSSSGKLAIKPDSVLSDTSIPQVASGYPNCAPLHVKFQSAATNAFAWNWDFGDGSSSNLEDPVHVYITPGTYDVKCIAQTPGGSDTTFWKDYIVVSGPVPNIQTTFQYTCDSTMVQFHDNSLQAVNWNWEFGDGATSNVSSPLHAYSPGNSVSGATLTVALTVTDSFACNSSMFTTLNMPNYNTSFAHADTICIGDSTGFLPADTFNYSFVWDFGDSSYSTDKIPFHTYDTPGVYAIKVESMHALGCTQVHLLDSVHVQGVPADFVVLDSTDGCIGSSFTFIPSTMDGDYYRWNMGKQPLRRLDSIQQV
ncbi:MAG: PKD domain-containing protein, partial [Bacteroidetes bacterium]|nr:PKD domain-containing protein [Bacteroidota bacterium]